MIDRLFNTRRAWGARIRRHAPGALEERYVQGVALHWPAMDKPISTRAQVKAALRTWQDYHMDGRGWSDIAYQIAIDQKGRRWRLRGIFNRSAANGDYEVNGTHGAFLLIVADGEEPTPAMIKATRLAVRDFRKKYPNGVAVVGHGQLRKGGTACPGPAVNRLIRAKAFG